MNSPPNEIGRHLGRQSAEGIPSESEGDVIDRAGQRQAEHARLPAPGSIKAQVLAALVHGQALTGLDAWQRFGTSRLAALIHQLRHEGWLIDAATVEVETAHGHRAHVARYQLRSHD